MVSAIELEHKLLLAMVEAELSFDGVMLKRDMEPPQNPWTAWCARAPRTLETLSHFSKVLSLPLLSQYTPESRQKIQDASPNRTMGQIQAQHRMGKHVIGFLLDDFEAVLFLGGGTTCVC